ncbi:YvrJ family protein [Inconstantimicrobium porci]|uniref:YvrJ family protein n=1 Tax=Inconstantimicrobium porci TaxID=2652291 RepID=A0A7X2T1Q9_9CLOT|nr:YvrJ family protein [Inconstantimicrobium porci]MSR91862.1 YvrJ family protein [Inconstantimicrobium porci]
MPLLQQHHQHIYVNNGFPVAVAAYLLIRLEKQIKSLASSINKLNTIISANLLKHIHLLNT